jgi:hypothetical protein
MAEGILRRLIQKPIGGNLDSLVRVISQVKVDGQRDLSAWLKDWGEANRDNFVGNLTLDQIHDTTHGLDLDRADQQIMREIGVRDPNLCG